MYRLARDRFLIGKENTLKNTRKMYKINHCMNDNNQIKIYFNNKMHI